MGNMAMSQGFDWHRINIAVDASTQLTATSVLQLGSGVLANRPNRSVSLAVNYRLWQHWEVGLYANLVGSNAMSSGGQEIGNGQSLQWIFVTNGYEVGWGVTAQYMDYGTLKQTTADGQQLGTFSARDIAVGGTFAYALTNQFSGGVTAKFITSYIAGYNALAVAVDLGLNYFDEDHDLSLSAVARNLGGQVKAYDDHFERIPLDLQVGATKRIGQSPFRLSVTLSRLNDWSEGFGHHFAVGADILLGRNIYVAAGYNFRRADQMKINDSEGASSHGAGFSAGAGLQLERFKLHVAYGKYHVSASSILINLSYAL